MAVAMVSGAVLGAMPANIYATMTTIAATIVSQLDSAMTDSTNFAVKTLAEVGLVLMVITLLTNVAARGWFVGCHAPRFRWDAASDMGESAESGSRQLPAMSPPRRSVAYRRKIVDALWWAACVCCLAVVITPTLWMLIRSSAALYRFSTGVCWCRTPRAMAAACATPSSVPQCWPSG